MLNSLSSSKTDFFGISLRGVCVYFKNSAYILNDNYGPVV